MTEYNTYKDVAIKGSDEPAVAMPATLGVKFSNDIFLLESFLKKHNIQYEQSDLEDTPMGRAHRISRDAQGNVLPPKKHE